VDENTYQGDSSMKANCCNVMIVLFCVVFFVFLYGCFPRGIVLPDKFSTLKEVYPSDDVFDNLEGISPDSHKRVAYQAPYEDVFRIANVSATQAMMSVESINKSTGIIYAMKVTQEPGVWNYSACGSAINEKRYFYAIKISETGPETTEILILAKAQGAACYAGGASVGTVVGSGMGLFKKEEAEAYATVHWSKKIQDLLEYFNLIKNNLIAEGFI
jgi:hypothetical protein